MKILSLLLALTLLPTLAFAQLYAATGANTLSVDQLPDDSCGQLTPSNYDFGDEPVFFPSSAKTFYLVNGCSVNLIVTNVNATGQAYSQSNDCTDGQPIKPGKDCWIKTVFEPTFTGAHNQQLVVTDHKQGDNQLLQQSSALTGTGIHDMAITPTSCDFFAEVPSEADCTVTIQNNEPTLLSIDECQTGPYPFSEETSCPSSLTKRGGNGDSAKITLDFWAYYKGVFSGKFAVTTDSPEEQKNGKAYEIPLTGVSYCPPHDPSCP